MQPLEKTLRNRLERTVKDARDIAEEAARAALEQLGVGQATPDGHLSKTERELRRRLRVHGRQLGDQRHATKQTQELDLLIEEVAYEHWHRMLFARFLAENNLLMYPDPDDPVAVTLEECEDLAADEGAANGWELAARFAACMLPQIFRLDSPVFELTLPPEHEQKLERLVAELPLEVFTASDSLGWVYQFWQAKKKDEVNASEVKIGARELPAVTQLFTEPYMVSFLLDNSLGAWWAARKLTEADLINASSEEELRSKAAIPGVSLEYLRFVQLEDGSWTPAAGTFDAWPEQLCDLKTLDPCCGSGHFLVAAFLMLVPIRMVRDSLSAQEAVDSVLKENIHGLELDQRCVELAAFAMALTAWKYPNAGGYRILPELNLACSGLSISAKKDEWLALAGDNTNLHLALEEIYKQFKDAPVLGSLINPEVNLGKGSLFELKWEEVGALLTKALTSEQDDEKNEIGVVAKGIAHSTSILINRYHHVFTNPPYLTIKKQEITLKNYCEQNYPIAKHDVATVFLVRLKTLLEKHGCISIVLPQNWTFQSSYTAFRQTIISEDTLLLISRLGAGAFDSISGEIVKAVLLLLSTGHEQRNWYGGIDVSNESGTTKKGERLICNPVSIVSINSLTELNDYVVRLTEMEKGLDTLFSHAISMRGIVSGDNDKWTRKFFEINNLVKWRRYQGTPGITDFYTGKINVIDWSNYGSGMLRPGSKNEAYGRKGVAVGQIGELPSTLFEGELYDNSTGVLIPHNECERSALWAYLSSKEYSKNIREIDQALKVTNATLVKASFDLKRWTKIAVENYPNGLPKPYSDDPTQWIFHGHPCGSVVWDEVSKWTTCGSLRSDDTVLQVAVARLLGYRWPSELDTSIKLADEQRKWVNHCEGLLSYADEDGIACIPPVRGEAAAADRLLNLLAAAYGDDWSNDIQAQLLKHADHAGKSLETWLREKFFTRHCKLFQHRPFIWHIWDGLRDGFAALVNYHKLDHKLLETLTYTYLGDWISRQKQDTSNGVDGAQERLAAAEGLKKKLELILEGEEPYDIFVRWKPIEKQPIGWSPDLNDGVRLNIRPFLTVPDVGKKGTGVLRDKPNIKWTKDRGKDVESAPWYNTFNGDRINDHHLSLADKRAAREKHDE